ncbi:unnamed protein product [Candida verbasci]|uniref:Beta-hexosaminidase n=1 Tax=Candida verbasci TaxID=1227364 RepID=A0A9W4XBX3_9ASCO|nr:unnamed protein product [Candida verbasci]
MIINWLLFYYCSIVFSVAVNPLPKPQNLTWQDVDNPIILNIDDLIITNLTNSSIIHQAINRTFTSVKELKWYPYTNETKFNFSDNFSTSDAKLSININDYYADLQFGVDESYNISVTRNALKIDASTIWGALHGLTTLQQLIVYNDEKFYIEGSLTVIDYPNYPHRGLLIDSARNYLTVPSILEQIDLLSISKMNSLHWHIVDTQSWPLELESYPEMTDDAYSKDEVYTRNDIEYIIDYAKYRGVRIIPEIDMPGHARAGWRQIDPNLVECGNEFWSNAGLEPPPGQLNILNNETYIAIANVFNEVSEIFEDKVFHVGLDELGKTCYPQDWFNDNKTLSDLTQYYLNNALPIFNNATNDKKLIMWDDVLLSDEAVDNLSTNITIQIWHDPSGIKQLTSKGYDVIISSYTYLYLDCGYGGYITSSDLYTNNPKNNKVNSCNGGSYCTYKTWQRIYDLDFTANLTETEQKHVKGAEVTLFGEQVDSTVLTGKIWPRSAALAESTWSGNKFQDGSFRNYDLTQRILNFREFLVKLGYSVSPIAPKYCVMNPHKCDQYEYYHEVSNSY